MSKTSRTHRDQCLHTCARTRASRIYLYRTRESEITPNRWGSCENSAVSWRVSGLRLWVSLPPPIHDESERLHLRSEILSSRAACTTGSSVKLACLNLLCQSCKSQCAALTKSGPDDGVRDAPVLCGIANQSKSAAELSIDRS